MAVTFAGSGVMVRILQQGTHQLPEFRVRRVVFIELLLRAENRILRHLEDAELNHGFSGNFDLLLRLWIEPGASFPLLFYELPKSRHDEFAVLFGGLVGDGAKRIEEYAGGLFIGLRGCGNCALKFCLGHFEEGLKRRFIAREPHAFNKMQFRIPVCMELRPKSKPRAFAKPYCYRRNRSHAMATSQSDSASAHD